MSKLPAKSPLERLPIGKLVQEWRPQLYRGDRPFVMTVLATGLIISGFLLFLYAVVNIPIGFVVLLFQPYVLSNGLWALILSVFQLGFGLVVWLGHPVIRQIAVAGPGMIIGANLISGLTGNPWSFWVVALCAFSFWYFRTQAAKVYLGLD